MDETSKKILQMTGIHFETEIDRMIIPREQMISLSKYEEIQKLIPDLKQIFSSSYMTGLQMNACKEQKWPLLNLIRQILNVYHYDMEPIRKSDGYTKQGVKKYKRFFLVVKRNKNIEETT